MPRSHSGRLQTVKPLPVPSFPGRSPFPSRPVAGDFDPMVQQRRIERLYAALWVIGLGFRGQHPIQFAWRAAGVGSQDPGR